LRTWGRLIVIRAIPSRLINDVAELSLRCHCGSPEILENDR